MDIYVIFCIYLFKIIPVANKKSPKSVDFEAALKSLEAIVANMETQDLSLEDSLSQFEEGIKLAKQCQQTLQNAKLRVEKLMEMNGDETQE